MLDIRPDLPRNVLAVLFIGGLLGTSFWVLRPFLPAIIWSTMLVVATWPVMLRVQARLWQRRSLAVTLMTLILLLLLIVPLAVAIATIVEHADQIVGWAKLLTTLTLTLPPLPEWVGTLPVVGPKILQIWSQVDTTGIHELLAKVAPYTGAVTSWFVAEVGSFGMLFLQFLLTVIISAILYARGEGAAAWMLKFGGRLAGDQGAQAVVLAGRAIRGVALGVVVTALAQAVAGGVGLAVAGVPLAAVLTAVMFMLCIAQLGPVLVLAPAVVWTYWSGESGWGTFLLVWTIVVVLMDNFIRPILIRKGADLPLLLIFAGVIGGLFAFGLVGIFIGPVVLAVAYTLLDVWVREEGLDRHAA
jgi:predicted PurR-regulated permease PerM